MFINENLTPTNSKLAFNCRKLKRDGHIEKTYKRNGVVCIQHSRVYKILYITILFNMFPDLNFVDHFRDEEHNESL